MDPDSLTVTVLVPENAASPIVVFDDNAALKAAIVERGAARHLTDEWDAAGLYILVDRCDSEGFWGVYVGQGAVGSQGPDQNPSSQQGHLVSGTARSARHDPRVQLGADRLA